MAVVSECKTVRNTILYSIILCSVYVNPKDNDVRFVPFTLNAHSTNSKIVLHCSKHCYFVDYYSCCSFRINSRECSFDVDTITASAAVEEEGWADIVL